MTAYYNEIEPYAADWLENLIREGHIAPGVVDRRSIEDVLPNDLRPFKQCHFFAGIGVWSYALRQARWPDDHPVWTGSCPCQPFSAAGKGAGFNDERHLWDSWHYLIGQCHPDVIFGEQVEAAIRHGWLDLIQSDLEGEGYAVGAVGFPACGVGAPHIRSRLWFVAERLANTVSIGRTGIFRSGCGGLDIRDNDQRPQSRSGLSVEAGGLGHALDPRLEGQSGHVNNGDEPGRIGAVAPRSVAEAGDTSGLADAESSGWQGQPLRARPGLPPDGIDGNGTAMWPGPVNGFWRNADWLGCRDGKWRPVEPCTFPLAHGAASRVGRLRAYGNAINAEAAQAVIKAYTRKY